MRLLAGDHLDVGDLEPDVFGYFGGGVGVAAEQDDGELLATVARRRSTWRMASSMVRATARRASSPALWP